MPAWQLIGGLAAGATALVSRAFVRRSQQGSAARASGLEPAHDLSHLPTALQQTALWHLGDGGFERRILRGTFARPSADIDITAFDLETLRERRGEWAWLPVEPPFRIGGVVSVVACQVPRRFPHVLIKCAGAGDELTDDSMLDRMTHVAKSVRDGLGVARSYAAEMPTALPPKPVEDLPDGWRAYTRVPELLGALLSNGLGEALSRTNHRDLVIELLDSLVIVYPAAHDAAGADALADLAATALGLVDPIVSASASSERL